ncbi:MAG: DNA mismatch repair protein MutS [Planctomycetaceae bacterium]|nr:DNA mismatch repair protein MutS [Planctomycetaceae bacterium]
MSEPVTDHPPPATSAPLTPMMARYLEVKAQNPGALLLFRMGDFYELFYEDAQTAAKVLGLTLTSRDKGSPNPTAMAGFPYHALNGYLQKLVRAGFRAAICEQVEDPKQAKGLVKREVTQVVTPGTLTDDALLDPRESNFLACVAPGKEVCGLAWLELSTGRFWVMDVALANVADELARIRPAECLLPEDARQHPVQLAMSTLAPSVLCERPSWCFSRENCRQRVLDQLGVRTLEGFDLDGDSIGVTAAGALLEYVRQTQKSELSHITRIEPYRRGQTLLIDEATRRSLELTHTLRAGQREGSLLAVLDETVSPMGARLLAEWLSNPLTDATAINRRLDAVQELVLDGGLRQALRDLLKDAYDVPRLTARIATGRASPRDLVFLARTLAILPRLKAKLTGRRASRLSDLEGRIELCTEVRSEIEAAIVDEPPLLITDGGVIRDGYHAALDEYRDLAKGGKAWIAKYQAEEIQRTGIPNLKVGFNRVFGYYLECTAAQADKVPADYIRKQTLKNQERFITPALKEYEDKVLRAEGQSTSLEQELFLALRTKVAQYSPRLRENAEILAEIDVLAGLAELAVQQGYCRPEIVAEAALDILEGRHPVLDRLMPRGHFVPNDIQLGDQVGRVQIITGPNMAGKSTYIRQAALLTILTQMGSFVPATSARVGLADRVFARVGASDELGKGQSTFMVEMTETARILNAATQRSLVILDEIGRGTSTYDGISLAWAVTEFLHDAIGCRTLFATHYHELTQLTGSLKHAANWNVAVREQNDAVVFLHKIVPGAADKSYGIHVAQLAGVPADVLDRAKIILKTLETDHVDETGKTRIPTRTIRKRERQLALFSPVENHPVLDELRQMDMETMSPDVALRELQRMRQLVGQ